VYHRHELVDIACRKTKRDPYSASRIVMSKDTQDPGGQRGLPFASLVMLSSSEPNHGVPRQDGRPVMIAGEDIHELVCGHEMES
jgi:hypothetical protein